MANSSARIEGDLVPQRIKVAAYAKVQANAMEWPKLACRNQLKRRHKFRNIIGSGTLRDVGAHVAIGA